MSSKFYSAPPGCLQWNTGATNIFTSFNWNGTPNNLNTGVGNSGTPGARLLANQYYKVCFRQETGMFLVISTVNLAIYHASQVVTLLEKV